MNKKPVIAFLIFLVLVIATAGAIAGFAKGNRLEGPGVKLSHLYLYDENGNIATTNSVYLPARVLDYHSELMAVQTSELTALPKDTTHGRRSYRNAPDAFPVNMFVVLMGTDRTSIHQPQYCLVGQGFSIDKTERVTVPVEHPRISEIPAMKLTTTKRYTDANGNEVTLRGVLVYWFVSKDHVTAEHSERMYLMAEGLITERALQRWAYVVSYKLCAPGQEEETYLEIANFLSAAVPQFQWVDQDPAETAAADGFSGTLF